VEGRKKGSHTVKEGRIEEDGGRKAQMDGGRKAQMEEGRNERTNEVQTE
jgi:hypothetical protein